MDTAPTDDTPRTDPFPHWRPDLPAELRMLAIGLAILHGGGESHANHVIRWIANDREVVANARHYLKATNRAVAALFRDLKSRGIDPAAYLAQCVAAGAKPEKRQRRKRAKRTYRSKFRRRLDLSDADVGRIFS